MSRLRRILWRIQDSRHIIVPVIGMILMASFWSFFLGVLYYGATR